MLHLPVIEEFLAQHRLALVGASADRNHFGNTVFRALQESGYDVVPVNPFAAKVEGEQAYASVADVPGEVDGVVVMVDKERAVGVVQACIERRVPRVWLFKGMGAGAYSDAAAGMCRDAGIAVVEGACPLMFLEPVGWFHRMHRGVRRWRGAFAA